MHHGHATAGTHGSTHATPQVAVHGPAPHAALVQHAAAPANGGGCAATPAKLHALTAPPSAAPPAAAAPAAAAPAAAAPAKAAAAAGPSVGGGGGGGGGGVAALTGGKAAAVAGGAGLLALGGVGGAGMAAYSGAGSPSAPWFGNVPGGNGAPGGHVSSGSPSDPGAPSDPGWANHPGIASDPGNPQGGLPIVSHSQPNIFVAPIPTQNVPEPSAAMILLTALTVLALVRWTARRRV